MSDSKDGIEFLQSMRGQYIMAQALVVAIKTMGEVPLPYRESSNISDMKFLLEKLFPQMGHLATAGVQSNAFYRNKLKAQNDKRK